MNGRNGFDPLNTVLLVVSMVITLITSLFSLYYIGMLSWVLLLLVIFRAFSKNLSKRREENHKFLRIAGKAKKWLSSGKQRAAERKTHRHFKCVKCGAELRVPKGKGTVIITCPVCKNEIKAKT
jgi:DNA-directed RNA polymerase subunit RPC12/RpoP